MSDSLSLSRIRRNACAGRTHEEDEDREPHDGHEQREDHPTVPVVGDAPAVVDVADEVDEHLVRHVLVERDELLELQHRALEIRVGEFVTDIETPDGGLFTTVNSPA